MEKRWQKGSMNWRVLDHGRWMEGSYVANEQVGIVDGDD